MLKNYGGRGCVSVCVSDKIELFRFGVFVALFIDLLTKPVVVGHLECAYTAL